MLKLLKKLSKTNVALICVSVLLVVGQVYCDLSIPDYMSDITILLNTSGSTIGEILLAGAKMLAFALGSLCFSILVAFVASGVATDFCARIRQSLFYKVQDSQIEDISMFSTSTLITRTTNDITQVQTLMVMGLQLLVKAPITAVWAITKLSGKSYEWLTATCVAVIVLLVVVTICMSLAVPRFKKIQTLTDKLNTVTRENLTGISVVRAYNAEQYQLDKFDSANNNLSNTNIFTNRTMSFMMPSIQLIMNGLTLSIYWIGALLINEAVGMDKLTLYSDMVVYSSYAVQIVMSFMMLVMLFAILPRALVSAKRINQVLDQDIKIVDGTIDKVDNGKGVLQFDNVSFSYPDASDCVLQNISFTANAGETVAIIGSTGSGKSTLVNLIPRFYDVTDGQILLDGINIQQYSMKSLRSKIGYVAQKAFLFRGDIKSNVAYGSVNIDSNNIQTSVDIADAKEFVENMDNGYDGYVAQGGRNLSGGQKQRLSIARAIYKNADILIFDDAFSALDYKTDRSVRSKLNKQCQETTKIIVAQRIGTIRNADKILVLHDGVIVGQGTHSQLIDSCVEYKQIALSQLAEEEL